MYGSQSKDPSLFRDDAAVIKGVYITCMHTGGVCTRVCVCVFVCVILLWFILFKKFVMEDSIIVIEHV